MDPATAQPTAAKPDLVCPQCGYDLRAIDSDRCPECGLPIDRQSMSVSRLPWAHRRQIGYIKAYWRTNLLAMFRIKKLAAEMERPVSYADSQRFRHVTVFLACIPLAVALAVPAVRDSFQSGPREVGSDLGRLLTDLVRLSSFFSIWLFLYMVSGVGSYFYHPRCLAVPLQNRAVALSYYTCAPLAWLWLPGALYFTAEIISDESWRDRSLQNSLTGGLIVCGTLTLIAIWALCWIRTSGLLKRTTHCGVGRDTLLAVYIPIAWLVCVVLAAAIPFVLYYISLIWLNVR